MLDPRLAGRVGVPYMAGDITEHRGGWLSKVTFASVWFFVFTIPWENSLVIPGMGTIGRVSGLLAFLTGLLTLLAEASPRAMRLAHGLLMGFVLWSSLSYIWSIDQQLTTERILTNIQLLLMVLLLWQFVRSRRALAQMMSAYVMGTLVSCAYTMANYLKGVTAVYNRYAAPGYDPNDLGLILALSIPMSAYLAGVEHRRLRAWLYRLHLPIVLWCIVLTASRGALLAVLAAMCFVPFTFNRVPAGRKALLLALSGVVLAGAIYMAPQSALERLSTTHSELASGSLNERRDIWKAGLQVWNENPVLGIGAGAFQEAVRPLFGMPLAAHNLFVALLAELGVVGCVLFAGSMVACAVTSFKLPPMERRLAFAVLATLVIGVMGLEWEWRKPAWFMLALCCGWSESGPSYRLVFRPAVRRP